MVVPNWLSTSDLCGSLYAAFPVLASEWRAGFTATGKPNSFSQSNFRIN